jgi:GTP-binding protein EngB required for normal cell division
MTITVAQSLTALQEVIDDCRGRVPDATLDPAQAIVNRAGKRLMLSGDTTVVALAGATGAGKSSLFNALSRTALAETGVKRPTTSRAMSMSFGASDTDALLGWLSVPRRHSVPGQDLTDLVLIDLPDYDSTEQRHRDEVDRMIELVDVILWVVDPQKYADAALHDRYLIPMASHAEVMIFVLNQIDRVRPEQIDRIRADLAQLLASEGITGVDIHAVSAATGQGVDQLRRALRDVARRKQAVGARLVADVRAAAGQLSAAVAPAPVKELSDEAIRGLNSALAEAAGVDDVTTAIEASWRYRGSLATGYPVASWLRRLRPDPLRRLHLTAAPSGPNPTGVNHTSIRAWQTVPAARVDSAIRTLADDSVKQLPRGWQKAVQQAARSQEATLPDQLDHAIGSTDLGVDRKPGWWTFVKLLQYLFFLCLLGGAGWLLFNTFIYGWLGLPKPADPPFVIGNVQLPTLMVVGGFVLGVLLALLCRAGVRAQAKAKQAAAGKLLRRVIAQITQGAIVEPVNAELRRHNHARAALNTLL